ncbi:MAG: circadian clock KaiB family protein [Rhodovibrio sp.]|nr:circadian clock KaiB family protein [Rhodovibrio sp.]
MNAGSQRRPDAQVDSLTVFIAGDAPSSRQAMTNLTGVLDQLGIPPERLQVVDVLSDPAAALEAGALVTPSLQIKRGQRARWFLGDLTDQRDLLAFLS